MKNTIFYLGMGALFTYELDAMTNHEWRILPLLNLLPDDTGMSLFILAHIPLFGVLIALVAASNPTVRQRTRFALSAFLIINGMLHALFMSHPNYEFHSIISNILIFGGGVLGALHLVFESRNKDLVFD